METPDYQKIFTPSTLVELFPPERADQFFDALFGDAEEGSYDIDLVFSGFEPGRQELRFELHLKERPGKCLACNLTYGLPEVFSRHPMINLRGLTERIAELAGPDRKCRNWRLAATKTVSRQLHVIPLLVELSP